MEWSERALLFGSSVRGGALPSPDLTLAMGLRQWRGRGALEVSLNASIPNRYRALEGTVSLSAHHLDVAACGVLRARALPMLRPYFLPCGRLRAGVFVGRGEGYAVSRDAVRGLFSPGVSVHSGLSMGRSPLQLQADLFAGWLPSRARYIVRGEAVATSRPYLLSAGLSLVLQLPDR